MWKMNLADLMVVFIMLVIVAAPAETSASESVTNEEAHKLCTELSKNAEMIATLRYEGAAMRSVMDKVEGSLHRAMVRDAYNLPNYQTKEIQQETVREFGNKIYAECYDSFSP